MEGLTKENIIVKLKMIYDFARSIRNTRLYDFSPDSFLSWTTGLGNCALLSEIFCFREHCLRENG